MALETHAENPKTAGLQFDLLTHHQKRHSGHTIKGRDSRWEFIETRRHYSSINVKFSQTRNSCELRLELSVKIVGLREHMRPLATFFLVPSMVYYVRLPQHGFFHSSTQVLIEGSKTNYFLTDSDQKQKRHYFEVRENRLNSNWDSIWVCMILSH